MIVCAAPNPAIDKLFEVERLEPGYIHRPGRFVQVPGGKGLNLARAAAALGAEVRVVALLGGHAGKWIEGALAREGIAARCVWTTRETRSCVSVADRETGRLTEFYESGMTIAPTCWPEFVGTLSDLLPSATWLTVSGALPLGLPHDGYRGLLSEAELAGVPVALDSRGEPLREALPGGPDIVKVNDAEAAELLQTPVETPGQAKTAAGRVRALAGGDGHAALVTRGAQGIIGAAPDGSFWEGMVDVRGPYPVGSGDAFLAGLIVALDRGEGWPEALRTALGAAAANAELPGAGILDASRARELADLAEVRLI